MKRVTQLVLLVACLLLAPAVPADARVEDVVYCSRAGTMIQHEMAGIPQIPELGGLISSNDVSCTYYTNDICTEGGGGFCVVGPVISATGIAIQGATAKMVITNPAHNHVSTFTCTVAALSNGCSYKGTALFHENVPHIVECSLTAPLSVDPSSVKLSCGEWANAD